MQSIHATWVSNGLAKGEGQNEDKLDDDSNPDWQAQPFALADNISLHLYVSDAPCGDASMELTMAAQPDATPWPTTPSSSSPDMTDMPGRGHFSLLGVVRRKPGRADAPSTLSKSCSDKLALKQCTSLLSGVGSLLVHPAGVYLRSVVVPEERCVRDAVERAFGVEGRMAGLGNVGGGWGGGYEFGAFEVKTTERMFEYCKPVVGGSDGGEGVEPVGSNLSALWTWSGKLEVLINGVLQGRKQFDPRGASCVSRRKVWESVREVLTSVDEAGLCDQEALRVVRGCATYEHLKACQPLQARERVKRDARNLALRGWTRNTGDADWRFND
ncbi:hypothetical protein LTR82_001836 [Friedmanniomyces endolithicus]|uniref:A to I editase domain-containing protein n=1 Tax=Friedmanniomyces endolithicus TaxID=329885 RepID=A0AAN6JEB7_9PEZI|nr:hypothetical protein LTR82_001836 [Friedmanniomyces endolithicus]